MARVPSSSDVLAREVDQCTPNRQGTMRRVFSTIGRSHALRVLGCTPCLRRLVIAVCAYGFSILIQIFGRDSPIFSAVGKALPFFKSAAPGGC